MLVAACLLLLPAGRGAAQTEQLLEPEPGRRELGGTRPTGRPGCPARPTPWQFNPNLAWLAGPLTVTLDGTRTVQGVNTLRGGTAAVTIAAGSDPAAALTLSGSSAASRLYTEAANLSVAVAVPLGLDASQHRCCRPATWAAR